MIRTLLTTTVLTALLATGAYAQNAAAPATPPASQPPAAAGAAQITGYTLKADDHMASNVIGAPVYESTDANAQDIGNIANLVVNKDGTIGAVVIGVGGFLGVGQKNVAIDYSKLQWNKDADGNVRIVLPTTKQALNAAPDFKQPNDKLGANANNMAANNPAGNAAGAAGAGAAGAVGGAMGNAADNAEMAASNSANAAGNAANGAAAGAGNAANNMAANAPAANAGEGNKVDVASLKPVGPNSLKTDDLKGIDVINKQGQVIGSIDDFVLDNGGKVDAVIVGFGGFVGIGDKKVALGLDNLQFVGDDNGARYLMANVTKEEVEKQTAYDPKTYQQNRDKQRLVVSGSA